MMYRIIWKNGFIQNNQALVALLGLCPLMAVSNSMVNALGLAMATLFVTVFSNVIVSSVRNYIAYELRAPVFVMLISVLVVVAQLMMQAFWYDLYRILGIFVPLIVTNCMILGRAESFAYKNAVLPSLVDGLSMGIGFAWVLLLIGGIREILSNGTLFDQMGLILGDWADVWRLNIMSEDYLMIVFAFPAGAFWVLGFLIGCRNYFNEKRTKRSLAKSIVSL